MKVYKTEEIRNVALIGGAKSGKTTLSESILFQGGLINRRGSVDDKNTISDYRQIELERQNSVFSTILYTEHKGKKINLIDTPGFDDYMGEVVTALAACDAAVMVLNAQNGVEVGTEIHWRHTNRRNTPVIFAINHLEHENSNFNETLNQLKQQFGGGVTITQYPVNVGLDFNSIIDLLSMKLLKYPKDGGKPEVLDIPEEEKENAENLQNTLIENAAEHDESLMETFFENGTLAEEEIMRGIKLGLMNREMFPVFCVAAKPNMGVERLLDFIAGSVPAPNEMPAVKTENEQELTCNADDPVSAFVFKTSIEEHLGKLSYFKMYGGKITESMDLINANTDAKERVSQIYITAGKKREKVSEMNAGDIGATIKLKDTHTNNTLNSQGKLDKVNPIQFPEPKHRVAIKAKNQGDEEKMGTTLYEIAEMDPTLLVNYSKELKQLIVQGQGEQHLNTAKWMLENIEKVPIEFFAPRIPYRETITKEAKADFRHKKQSGGSGQFGEVHMMIEPYYEGKPNQKQFPVRNQQVIELEWGGKLVFNNCIVGGAIDAKFMPAIIKGIMEKLENGPLTGSYARDIAVSVYDGKMHPVDSNEVSFKIAGRTAFATAFKNAGPKILEPIYFVEVLTPEENMGDVMTDLQGRRAIIQGMDSEGHYQRIRAKVPLATMNKYSTALSSLSSGRATYTMRFDEYAPVPGDVQEQLLKEYEVQQNED